MASSGAAAPRPPSWLPRPGWPGGRWGQGWGTAQGLWGLDPRWKLSTCWSQDVGSLPPAHSTVWDEEGPFPQVCLSQGRSLPQGSALCPWSTLTLRWTGRWGPSLQATFLVVGEALQPLGWLACSGDGDRTGLGGPPRWPWQQRRLPLGAPPTLPLRGRRGRSRISQARTSQTRLVSLIVR